MTLFCAIAAALILAVTFMTGMNDQRRAAIAALATGMAAVPYVFTRAVEGLGAGQAARVGVVEEPVATDTPGSSTT